MTKQIKCQLKVTRDQVESANTCTRLNQIYRFSRDETMLKLSPILNGILNIVAVQDRVVFGGVAVFTCTQVVCAANHQCIGCINTQPYACHTQLKLHHSITHVSTLSEIGVPHAHPKHFLDTDSHHHAAAAAVHHAVSRCHRHRWRRRLRLIKELNQTERQ